PSPGSRRRSSWSRRRPPRRSPRASSGRSRTRRTGRAQRGRSPPASAASSARGAPARPAPWLQASTFPALVANLRSLHLSARICNGRKITTSEEIGAEVRNHATNPWAVLVLVCLAQFMVVLDATIVNVALPSIQQDLHLSDGSLQW